MAGEPSDDAPSGYVVITLPSPGSPRGSLGSTPEQQRVHVIETTTMALRVARGNHDLLVNIMASLDCSDDVLSDFEIHWQRLETVLMWHLYEAYEF